MNLLYSVTGDGWRWQAERVLGQSQTSASGGLFGQLGKRCVMEWLAVSWPALTPVHLRHVWMVFTWTVTVARRMNPKGIHMRQHLTHSCLMVCVMHICLLANHTIRGLIEIYACIDRMQNSPVPFFTLSLLNNKHKSYHAVTLKQNWGLAILIVSEVRFSAKEGNHKLISAHLGVFDSRKVPQPLT